MESIIYVNTTDKTIRASTTALALPTVDVRLQTHLKLTAYFFAAGADPALISGASFRVALKDYNEPSGSVLALLSAATATGDDYYEFEWASVDSSALRTLIGDAETTDATLEIEWTVGSNVERASMPVTIKNAWIRSEDDAPDPVADASWTWLKARLAAGTNVTFSDNDTTKVRTIAASGGAGSGDVTGPASSTDNALVRFDSTTGKVIQNGNVTQSDDGDLAAVNSIAFDTTPTGAIATQGQMMWNADEATLDIQLNGFVIHTGSHSVYRVKNSTGSTISKGAPVMFAGTDGNSGTLLVQEWDGVGPVEYFLGLLAEDLTDGSSGFAIQFGKLRGITTDGSNYSESWSNGDVIYASATAGELTKTAPAAPNPLVLVCAVVSAHATNGTLFVRPTIGTVAKVAMTVPTGLQISGSPVTNNGTLAVSYASGYQGYTTTEASKLSGIEAGADVTDATNIATAIDGATAKTTPVDADTVPLIDSAASSVLKKLSWANIKATLKSYFDTIYGNVTGPASVTDNAVARFDGTTGKLAQNSALVIDDAGQATLAATTAVNFQIGPATGQTGGPFWWVTSDPDWVGNDPGFTEMRFGWTSDEPADHYFSFLFPHSSYVTQTLRFPEAIATAGQVMKAASVVDGVVTLAWDSTGTGDVVGPASSTSGHVATFSNTTGKLIASTSIGAALNSLSGTVAEGAIIARDASTWYSLPPGTSGQVLTSGGAGAAPSWQTSSSGGGKVAQMVVATSNTPATSSVIIPLDDTIPQNTEGTEFITATITPTNASSTLVIEFEGYMSCSTVLNAILALFVDSDADAIQAIPVTIVAGNYMAVCRIKAVVTAGSTSARTYKLRYGPDRTAAVTMLRSNAASSYFSTADSATFTITEITP